MLRPPTSRLRLRSTLLLIVLLATAGCAVKWTPFYDETLDRDITSFQQSTEGFLTNLENLQAPACTYQQNVKFYQQQSVQLTVMRTRAVASPHPKQLLEMMDSLSKNLTDLQTLQQNAGSACLNATVIEIARKGFEPVFESLLAYELALKANQPPATAPSK